jgi:hypothetical protein
VNVNYKIALINSSQIVIHDFQIVWPTPLAGACLTLRQDWENLILAGNWSAFYASYNAFYKSMTQQAENFEVILAIGSVPLCSSGSNRMTVDFYESGCIKTCQNPKTEEPQLVQVKCGDACCKRTTKFCKDINNNPVVFGTPVVSSLGPCVPIIHGTCFSTDVCRSACARL